MPFLVIGGLVAVSMLGFLWACGENTRAEFQAALGAEESADDPRVTRVRANARQLAEILQLSAEQHATLRRILLHEADRLEAARRSENEPEMRDALADHHLAVREWKARELRRALGAELAARIEELERAEQKR